MLPDDELIKKSGVCLKNLKEIFERKFDEFWSRSEIVIVVHAETVRVCYIYAMLITLLIMLKPMQSGLTKSEV